MTTWHIMHLKCWVPYSESMYKTPTRSKLEEISYTLFKGVNTYTATQVVSPKKGKNLFSRSLLGRESRRGKGKETQWEIVSVHFFRDANRLLNYYYYYTSNRCSL